MHQDRINLMLVAGEPSGDAHASALATALKTSAGSAELELFGATGPLMRAAGVESAVRSDDLSILGLLEIGRALPKFWTAYETLKQEALERNPDAVVLVDWPDFNFRLARSLHARGLKIIYYISPQLWAWRSHRVRNIQRDVDLLLAILPFEPGWYAARGVEHVEFVGHPLAGEVRARYGRDEFCRRHGLEPGKAIISLLPGSRAQELKRILPPMLEAASIISDHNRAIQFVLAIAPSRSIDGAHEIISSRPDAAKLRQLLTITQHETREALAASHAAAIASGTATLEAALLGTPMVIVYKESRLNWHTLGRLITAEHFGLVNLIAGERLVTELMQNDFTGERLAEEISALLEPQRNEELRHSLNRITAQLGNGGASQRAAKRILEAIREWNVGRNPKS